MVKTIIFHTFFSKEIEDILFQLKLFNLWYFISHVLQKLWSMLHVIKISIYNEIITLYILSLIFIVGLHLRSHTEYNNRVYLYRRLWHRNTPPLKIMFTYFVQSNFFLICLMCTCSYPYNISWKQQFSCAAPLLLCRLHVSPFYSFNQIGMSGTCKQLLVYDYKYALDL
jgi:hypothetical protein